jgi:hypothetical protein
MCSILVSPYLYTSYTVHLNFKYLQHITYKLLVRNSILCIEIRNTTKNIMLRNMNLNMYVVIKNVKNLKNYNIKKYCFSSTVNIM